MIKSWGNLVKSKLSAKSVHCRTLEVNDVDVEKKLDEMSNQLQSLSTQTPVSVAPSSVQTRAGMKMIIPATSSTSTVNTVITADTGTPDFHLQGWGFVVHWDPQYCRLVKMEIGNHWDNVSVAWCDKPGTLGSAHVTPLAPQFRLGDTGTFIDMPTRTDLYSQYPSVKAVCTQSSMSGEPGTWNVPTVSSYEFNKNKPAVLIAKLEFATFDWGTGRRQCIMAAHTQGFVNQGSQRYDTDVLYPVIDNGSNLAYTAFSFDPANPVFQAHNKMPIEDGESTGEVKFDGYFSPPTNDLLYVHGAISSMQVAGDKGVQDIRTNTSGVSALATLLCAADVLDAQTVLDRRVELATHLEQLATTEDDPILQQLIAILDTS